MDLEASQAWIQILALSLSGGVMLHKSTNPNETFISVGVVITPF